ncbi:MAG: 23S rRNA (uracil(1939)-C(5))-methyltransferase RlmD [Candidatus Obscuribacterales bacterium]|nr:23S rRNA (uracil(1939)-C(5))-methyltransferase RlmD [Candidatus Obscuribacterales bacterium]
MAKQKHTYHKNQKLRVSIESIAPGGQGFTKDPGLPVFVNRGVPGDLLEVELYDLRKDFAHARIVEVIEPSVKRTEPPCKLFKVCGGCQWQHIAYEHQLELKTDIVKQAIKHIGKLDPSIVLPTIPAADPLYYRNKVQFPVTQPHGSTRILAGYYKEGSHELVNIKHCPVQPEPLDRLLEATKLILEEQGVDGYDEADHTGMLRHITARFSFAFERILLTLVLNAGRNQFELLQSKLVSAAQEIMAQVPEVAGVCVNLNNARGNRIMGNETICIAGAPHIIEKLVSTRAQAPEKLVDGLSFRLSPTSFFQVNSAQAVGLLDLVLDAVQDWQKANSQKLVPLIIDAYAGVGTMALWLSALAEKVLAIEEVPAAVQDGRDILKLNEISNVEFYLGSVEKVFPELGARMLQPQILVLDPPRKGVAAEVLEHAAALEPELILYVSCNPSTLARDLKILQGLGYESRSIQPLDMFPQTHHVESLTILHKASR